MGSMSLGVLHVQKLGWFSLTKLVHGRRHSPSGRSYWLEARCGRLEGRYTVDAGMRAINFSFSVDILIDISHFR